MMKMQGQYVEIREDKKEYGPRFRVLKATARNQGVKNIGAPTQINRRLV